VIKEHDRVVLNVDLPEHGLCRGDVGYVVYLHGDRAFEVEFITLAGETVGVITLEKEQVRPPQPGELMHIRTIRQT
jgi:hypothetical protein